MMRTKHFILWIAASLAIYTEGQSVADQQNLVKRSDGLSSSRAASVEYAQNGGQSKAISQSSTNSTLARLSGHSTQAYLNNSLSTTDPPSSRTAVPFSSGSPIPALSSSNTSPEYGTTAESLPPANSSVLAPSSSSLAFQWASNSSSSHIVTAVYSRTHLSVIRTGDSAAPSSALLSTGAVHHASANDLWHSSAYVHSNISQGLANSSKSYLAAPSGYSSSSGAVRYPHQNETRTNSALPVGTGYHPSNDTIPRPTEGIRHGPMISSGYPFPNGSSSATNPGTTGIVGGYRNHTNATATIPRTGVGYSYAQACNKASVDWSSSWLQDQIHPGTVVSPTPAYTPPPDGNMYTLCDGVPRMRVNMTTVPTPYTGWTVTPPATLTGAPPEPNCTVVPSDCSQLLSSYSFAHGVPASVSLGRIHPYMSYIYDDWPRCTTNPIPSSKPGADCGIYGQGVQLMYWPQVWSEGKGKNKYCDALMGFSDSITLGPTVAGQPNTVVSGTHTFTSPTVYIKYSALSAKDWGDVPVGPTLYDSYIAVESTMVSTKLPYFWTNIPWEGPGGLLEIARSTGIINAKMEHGYSGINLNYADEHVPLRYPDLASPVPALPYYQQRVKLAFNDDTCWMGGCPTMMPWAYNPVLAIPDPVRYLAPEWNSCTLPWGAMDDPPKALVTQTAIAMPTMPVPDPATTPASPSPASALPAQQTGAGDAARTSAGNDPVAQPTSGNDGSPEKPENAGPTKAKKPVQDGDPLPGTSVDNQPSPTSTQNVGEVIASVIGAAGTQATTSQSDSTGVASSDSAEDENPDGNQVQSPGETNSDEQSTPGPNSNDPAPTAAAINDEPGSNPGDAQSDPTINGGSDQTDTDPPSTADGQAKITLGSDIVTARPATGTEPGVVVGSQTLTPGAPATDISGHAVSVNSGGEVHVDGTVVTQVDASPDAIVAAGGNPAKVTLAPGNILTAAPASGDADEIVVGTRTLGAGGAAAIIDEHTVSVGTDGVLAVDGSSAGSIKVQGPPSAPTPAPVTLGTKIMTAHDIPGSSGALVLGGKTLQEGGGVATLNGHVVSLGIHGKIHVDGEGADVGAVPSTLPFDDLTNAIAPLTVGSKTIFAEETTLPGGRKAAIIDGKTVLAGSAPTAVGDAVVSLGSDGLVLQTTEATTPFSASTALITAGPHVLTAIKTVLANGQTAAVIGTHTLTAEGAAQTIEGDVYLLASNGLIELDHATTADFESSAQLFTIDGKTLLAQYTSLPNGQTQVIIGDETLTSGGPAETIHGELVSLGPDGLTVGTATTSGAPSPTSAGPSIANAQISAKETGAANTAAVGRGSVGTYLTLALVGLLTTLLRY